jgi:sulfide:quinone oxidoreductase
MGARTVLILGGGVGGVVAANRLRRLLPRGHRVVLIDREASHVFQPSLSWVAVGLRRPEGIQRPLARLSRRGIEVVQAEIERIDPAARTVLAGGRQYEADALVITLGADLAPELIPGLAGSGHNLYTMTGASALRDALAAFSAGRLVVLTAAPAYKCPAAPYEAAMLIDAELRRRGIRAETLLDLYAAEPGPMGVAGPEVAAAVRAMVESKQIGYHPEHQVTTVDPVARRLTFANGATAEFDLLAYVPPHRAPAVVRASGLTAESGWISPDRRTFATRWPGVYAIGDVTSVPLAMGKPLPKAGVFAAAQAEVVAANIAAEWAGSARRTAFDGHGACLVEVGHGRAGLGSGDFYAEPLPRVRMRAPGRLTHWAKVWFEQVWLRRRL